MTDPPSSLPPASEAPAASFFLKSQVFGLFRFVSLELGVNQRGSVPIPNAPFVPHGHHPKSAITLKDGLIWLDSLRFTMTNPPSLRPPFRDSGVSQTPENAEIWFDSV